MGIKYFDAYSPSHGFGGLTFYLLGFDFVTSVILHTGFEIFENYIWVNMGGYCISLPFLTHRDCKTKPDSSQNIIGDTLFFMLGYLLGQFLIRKQYLHSLHLALKLIIIGIIVPLGYSIMTTNIIGYLPEYEHE
jgi:hypothetical protein